MSGFPNIAEYLEKNPSLRSIEDALIDVAEAAQKFSDTEMCLDPDCMHRVCVLNKALARLVELEAALGGKPGVYPWVGEGPFPYQPDQGRWPER